MALPVYGQRKCFRFAILDQKDMPDELRLTSAQYEDVIFNAYNQAELNSGDPDRHITYEIVHGKYHFFPNTSKRRIDLAHLMHAHGNQTYCPVLRHGRSISSKTFGRGLGVLSRIDRNTAGTTKDDTIFFNNITIVHIADDFSSVSGHRFDG